MRRSLGILLKKEGYQVATAENGEVAGPMLRLAVYDIVITDLKMTPLSGLDVLRMVKTISPQTEVIVMTAYGTIDSAVSAMKLGAYDYITKPFKPTEIFLKVTKALEKRRLATQVDQLQRELLARSDWQATACLVGKSPAMLEIVAQVERIAKTDLSVLLTGETGTGKNVVARAIHARSPRAGAPFVTINCAAVPESLLESELFGHTRGAFTGAAQTRRGLVEEASGGTFFLDEIGATPPSVQSKLLGVLEDRVIRRVGSNTPIKVNVRIIASTNSNLREAIERGEFREDLYYRLNVAHIHLPPLRERAGDIPLLASHFLHMYSQKLGREGLMVSPEALDLLGQYDFPGNIRELENLFEQAVAVCQGTVVRPEDFPLVVREAVLGKSLEGKVTSPSSLKVRERELILECLTRHHRNLNRAAKELGISRVTLWRKLKAYGIS